VRHLEIPSAPAMTDFPPFVDGLIRFCAANGVIDLEINSYGSPMLTLPSLPNETRRFARTEFVLDLDGESLLPDMSRDHRQRIKRAERAGLVLRRSTAEAACIEHARLIASSMVRREGRGEAVSTTLDVGPLHALVRSGAGELFQVVDGAKVLSSMLLLRAPRAAYDHTSGSSPEGMALGAARLGVFLACVALRSEGYTSLNLGGVRDNEAGLRAFKERFGARPVTLEATAATFNRPLVRVASGVSRLVRGALRLHEWANRFRGLRGG
jgi:hypothetical protein